MFDFIYAKESIPEKGARDMKTLASLLLVAYLSARGSRLSGGLLRGTLHR